MYLSADARLMARILVPPSIILTQYINIMAVKWQYKISYRNKHRIMIQTATDACTRNNNKQVGFYSHLDIMNTGILE